MAISTNHKPTIYRNLYENTGPAKNVELFWLYPLPRVYISSTGINLGSNMSSGNAAFYPERTECFYKKHGGQSFLDLKSSYMSFFLAISTSYEYLCYKSTAIINMFTLRPTVRGSTSDVSIRRLQTSGSDV